MANSPTGESMVERLLRVLEAFDARHSELTVGALAHRAGLPRTTAYRVVADLVEHGVIERTPGGRVRVGMRIWELSYRSLSARRLREIALPHMQEVQRRIQQHTNLAIMNDEEVLYVERLSTPRAARNVATIASRLPRHACSSGLVLMAFAPSDEQEAFLRERHARITPDTVTDPAQLRRLLAEIRQRGSVVARGHVVPESAGIAVPVFGESHEVIAAVNVIVPRDYHHTAAATTVLTQAATRITEAMRVSRFGTGSRDVDGQPPLEAPAPAR